MAKQRAARDHAGAGALSPQRRSIRGNATLLLLPPELWTDVILCWLPTCSVLKFSLVSRRANALAHDTHSKPSPRMNDRFDERRVLSVDDLDAWPNLTLKLKTNELTSSDMVEFRDHCMRTKRGGHVLITECPNLTSLEGFSWYSQVMLHRCYGVQDVSPLANVSVVTLWRCRNVTDIRPLKDVPCLTLCGYDHIKDLSVLTSVVTLRLVDMSGVTALSTSVRELFLSYTDLKGAKIPPSVRTLSTHSTYIPTVHDIEFVHQLHVMFPDEPIVASENLRTLSLAYANMKSWDVSSYCHLKYLYLYACDNIPIATLKTFDVKVRFDRCGGFPEGDKQFAHVNPYADRNADWEIEPFDPLDEGHPWHMTALRAPSARRSRLEEGVEYVPHVGAREDADSESEYSYNSCSERDEEFVEFSTRPFNSGLVMLT